MCGLVAVVLLQLSVFSGNLFDSVGITGKQCPKAPNCTVPGACRNSLVAVAVVRLVLVSLLACGHTRPSLGLMQKEL